MGYSARILGLCGPIASGKSTVAIFLQRKGYTVIPVDILAHTVVEEQKESILNIFGRDLLKEDGFVDRTRLGKIVFSNLQKKQELESLVHPSVIQKVKNQITPTQKFVIDAALLYPMGLDNLCEKVLVVTTYPWLRLARLCLKRKIGVLYALKILRAQGKLVPNNPKNVIIRNNGSLSRLWKQIEQLSL